MSKVLEDLRDVAETLRDKRLAGLVYLGCDEIERLRANLKRAAPYTVDQAKKLDVCRLCGVLRFTPPDSLVLDYGEEHAHQSCLNKAAAAAGGES